MFVRKGSAVWSGSLKEGEGRVSTQSGALDALPYGFNTRFADTPGTNPEELIGAAHAACFSMALSNMLGAEGIVPERIETSSAITLEKQGEGFAITRAHLVTRIRAPGDEAKILGLAEKAKAGCPVSKLLNAEVTMEASLG